MSNNFLNACNGKTVEQIPVWFMRQAGRSLPGYRKIREKYGVLELTQTPELAAAVSKEPVEVHGVDAAILFADIMILPIAMGIEVKIVDAVGPVIDEPLDTAAEQKRLRAFEPQSVEYLQKTIQILRQELSVPVIGFSGAPFTLASYLIEGKPTRTWHKTKQFMLTEPAAWHGLMETLSTAIASYLKVQIAAGAQAVQLFDSWVGSLSPHQYQEYVAPYNERIFLALKEEGVPRIFFGTNTATLLPQIANLDCEVVGVDWRVELGDARQLLGNKSLQGNLDPAILLSDWETVKKEVDRMFSQIDPKVGYIFNLGHGILPEADEQIVRKLVDYVHGK